MSGVILCTGSYDHTIKFWEATTGLCYQTIQFSDPQVNALAVSHNQDLLAAACHHYLRLYNIESSSQQPIATLEGHTQNITCIGFQKDDEWIYSASEDKTIRIWDLGTMSFHRELKCKSLVNTVALHPNQAELISGEENGTIRIFDLTKDVKEECIFKIQPTKHVAIRSISISSDGTKCVSANNKGDVIVWKIIRSENSVILEAMLKFKAHDTYILKCLISPDAKQICTSSADSTIKLFDITNGKLLKELKEHKRWVWDIAYSSDGAYLVSCSSDQTAKLWDLSKGECIKEYKGHQKAVVCLALHDQPLRK